MTTTTARILRTLSLLVLLAGVASAQNQRTDYVTPEEEDVIRDAQGVQLRVPVFLKLLDNRIVALDLRDRTPKEREQTKKDIAQWEAKKKEAESLKIQNAELPAKPLNPDIYLRHATRSELLRGYMQIVDETMDNIEDSFDRKLDVRGQIESLEKFVVANLPLLKKLEAKTPTETAALKAAIAHSELAVDEIRFALKQVPKNEKK